MNISINPTYYCNFRCSFCYLTEHQLSDQTTLEPHVLDILLRNIAANTSIQHIDLYGGEITTIRVELLHQYHEIIRKYYNGTVNVITNLNHTHPYLLRDDVDVSVSYDFECREKHERVLANIATFGKPVHILMLASECLLTKNVDDMICIFNSLHNIKTVEIKPYSTNQANTDNVTFQQYEQFVQQWIQSPVEKQFQFINEYKIQQSLSGKTNAFSDDHIYITPSGKYGVLEFDINDNEFFLQLETLDQYQQWTKKEKKRVTANKFCNNCQYFGNCLSEHLRHVDNIEQSCNGFKTLLDWYGERLEN